MKPIEYCLDRILMELEKNWTKEPREFLKAEEMLNEFELPIKHEFFIGFIDKLIKDGYVKFKSERNPNKSEIDYCQQETLITIDGYYFLKEHKGYTQKKINDVYENTQVGKIQSNQKVHRYWMTGLTIILAVGTSVAGWYYLIEILKNYKCH